MTAKLINNWLGLLLGLVLCVSTLSEALADEPQMPFDVRSAYVEPTDHGFLLHATLDLGLTKTAEEAVRNGVPLKVVLDVQMNRKRKFFIDKKLEDRSVELGLRYDALADRYIVMGNDALNNQAYSSLNEALTALGRIDNVHILTGESVQPKDEIEGSVRASVIVASGSSTVMRYLMFWIDWRRSTDWYSWHVKL